MSRCAAGSNWNPVQAECICPIGRNGSACESPALLACRLTPESAALACTAGRPLHCDCMAQCALAGAFSAHLYRYCFTTPAREAFSDLPPPDDATALYWRWQPAGGWRGVAGLQRVERPEAVRHEHEATMEHAPHSRCPKRCHERGACLVRPKLAPTATGECRCDAQYFGNVCGRHVSKFCWNGCSGRGECVDGFCVCRGEWYGPGCALGGARSAAAPTTSSSSSGGR